MKVAWAIPESVLRYLNSKRCAKCGQDNAIVQGMPCPFCHDGQKRKVVKPQPVINPGGYQTPNRKLKSLYYPSDSRKDKVHQVRCTTSGIFVDCSCEGFFYRKRCKHKDDFLFNKGKKGKKTKPH